LLEQELVKYRSTGIPFESVSREAKINYSEIQEMSYANSLVTNFSKIDTIPTFNVKWSSKLNAAARRSQMDKLEKWLQVRLSLDTLVVRTVN